MNVQENGNYFDIIFNDQKIMQLLQKETQLLPITNITGEELSNYLIKYLQDKLFKHIENGDINKISVSCSSSKGQSVTSSIKYKATESDQNVTKQSVSLSEKRNNGVIRTQSKHNGDKYLIITGGSSGIGQEICTEFINAGYKVINLSRSRCPIEGVDNYSIDLFQKLDQIEIKTSIINKIFAENSQNEIHLIHCASNHYTDNIYDDEISSNLEQSFMINSINPSIITQSILPFMSDGSSVLFIGSTLSMKAVANQLSYCTSKHAQIGLMKGIVQDLINKGDKIIHSAVICPGFTDTKMFRKAVKDKKTTDDFIKGFVGIQRLIEPKEIASFVFNVSQSPILNGSVLDVCGGQKET